MADGTIGDVMDAMETALKVNMGDGFDFSEPGRFARGRYKTPPKLPFLALANPVIESPQGPPLGSHEQSCRVLIMAWARAGGITLDQRARVSLSLLHHVKETLDTARNAQGNALNNGNLRTWQYEALTLDGESDEIEQGQCCAEMLVTFTYATRTGL